MISFPLFRFIQDDLSKSDVTQRSELNINLQGCKTNACIFIDLESCLHIAYALRWHIIIFIMAQIDIYTQGVLILCRWTPLAHFWTPWGASWSKIQGCSGIPLVWLKGIPQGPWTVDTPFIYKVTKKDNENHDNYSDMSNFLYKQAPSGCWVDLHPST